MKITARVILATIATASLGGCGSLNNIYWKNGLPGGGEVITVDAKQRHLLITPNGACAEAAPDVFTAVGTSVSGNGLFGGTEQSLAGAFSVSEAASAIGKTQTVNLIRESMYRTCERFISGAIDQRTFLIQTARDQRSMVALLAIEQLTGASRTQAAAIASPATQAAIANNTNAIALAQQRTQREAQLIEAANAAKLRFEEANTTGKCADGALPPEKEKDEEGKEKAEQPKLDAYNLCKLREVEYKAAQNRVDQASAQVSAALAAASNASASAAGATGGNFAQFPVDQGQGSRQGSGGMNIAEAVRQIALAPALNEPLMYCLSYLDYVTTVGPAARTAPRSILLEAKDPAAATEYRLPSRADLLADPLYLSCAKVVETGASADNYTRILSGTVSPTERANILGQAQRNNNLEVDVFDPQISRTIDDLNRRIAEYDSNNAVFIRNLTSAQGRFRSGVEANVINTPADKLETEIRKLGLAIGEPTRDIDRVVAACTSAAACLNALRGVDYFASGLTYFTVADYFKALGAWQTSAENPQEEPQAAEESSTES